MRGNEHLHRAVEHRSLIMFPIPMRGNELAQFGVGSLL